jgi:hypothetical protein
MTKEQIRLEELHLAMSKVTIEMLKSLGHSEEIELSNTHTLYHYTEEDVYVINLTSEWEEQAQVLFDEEGNITFEIL